jgi:hypothetical protein
MPDTDVLEQEQELEQQADQVADGETHGGKADEPHAEPADRQSIRDAVLNEGVEEAVISELADKPGELTIDDLRKLPGADDYTDEQLQAEWAKAVAAAGGSQAQAQTGEQQQTDQTFKLPFPVYDQQGNKIDALEKISLRDLFDGKLQIGYKALDQEQRKTLAEVIRNASLGHWNERQYQTTLGERNQAATRASELERQVQQFTSERQVWDAALTALAMGNAAPMRALADAFQKAIQQAPSAAPGMMSVEQVRRDQEDQARGFEAIQNYVYPKAIEISQKYGAKLEEVTGAIRWYIEHEPPQFFSKEKLDQIIQYQVPQLFESHGYKASEGGSEQTQTTQQPDRVAQLEQQLTALQSRIAGTANASTQQTREKTKKAPPAGGGSTPGAGDSMPSFKSRSQMKAYMQNDPDWQKA